ncbi:hypothetical protein CTH30272_03881 [Allocatenococcus thiocycli]|nr:hypothetical protein CTH30272_03881 [Catenococcus thiocycli]
MLVGMIVIAKEKSKLNLVSRMQTRNRKATRIGCRQEDVLVTWDE